MESFPNGAMLREVFFGAPLCSRTIPFQMFHSTKTIHVGVGNRNEVTSGGRCQYGLE